MKNRRWGCMKRSTPVGRERTRNLYCLQITLWKSLQVSTKNLNSCSMPHPLVAGEKGNQPASTDTLHIQAINYVNLILCRPKNYQPWVEVKLVLRLGWWWLGWDYSYASRWPHGKSYMCIQRVELLIIPTPNTFSFLGFWFCIILSRAKLGILMRRPSYIQYWSKT